MHNIQTSPCITRVPKQAFSKVNYMPRNRGGISTSAQCAGPLVSLLGLHQGVGRYTPLAQLPQSLPLPRGAARPAGRGLRGQWAANLPPPPPPLPRPPHRAAKRPPEINFLGLRCQLCSRGSYFPPNMLMNLVRVKKDSFIL